ncbi:MAG: hypothetical protein AAGH83_12015 [Pseudomonadota bacterium]
MFIELIATFAAGFGAAGVVLAINIITKGRLPKWVMPVAAGAAMIGVGVSNEYTWGARTAGGLPEGVVVVEEVSQSNWYRPWSYVVPLTARLIALDTASVQTNPDIPDIRLADLYLFARWQPPARVPQLINCTNAMRANATPEILADTRTAEWRNAASPLITHACEE